MTKKVQDTLAKANEVAEEATSSMRTVRSFANENVEAGRYADKLEDTYQLKKKEALAYATYMTFTQVLLLSVYIHLYSLVYCNGWFVCEMKDNPSSGFRCLMFIVRVLSVCESSQECPCWCNLLSQSAVCSLTCHIVSDPLNMVMNVGVVKLFFCTAQLEILLVFEDLILMVGLYMGDIVYCNSLRIMIITLNRINGSGIQSICKSHI